MYINNILSCVHPTCNHKIINQQYLGDSITLALQNQKNIIVHSGMSTGKTQSIKEILKNLAPDECACIQAPRTKLLRAMATELGFFHYEDLKRETDPANRELMARRLCVTPQSAPALFAEFPDIKYKLFVIDESETQAGMLVSTATKNKEKALDALKAVATHADHVVLMDAHASEKTESLMGIIAHNEPIHTLINTFKPWSVIDADILEGSNYSGRRTAMDALQIEAITQNKKIAICSSSKKYCQERKEALNRLYPALQILLITADDSQHTQDILNNPDLLVMWDVVIFSPAVSVGVSFDIPDHINQVFGVFPNTPYTGDVDDSIQALARIRKPIDCKWTICLDDDKNAFKNAPRCPDDIAIALGQREYRIRTNLQADDPNDTELQLINLYSVCEYERIHSKNHFNQHFHQRLHDMGVTTHSLNLDNVIENQTSNLVTESVKADAIEASFIVRTESTRITEEEAQQTIIRQKYKPWELIDGEINSLERFKAERDLMINFDDHNEADKRDYIALLDDGVIAKCVNREIALAPDDFTREYMIARRYGLGDNEAFKADVLNHSFNYPLLKKLLSYAVPYFEGQEYTHNSLKRGALVQFIERHLNEIKSLRIIILPNNWRSKPALLMNHLLDICGYNHTSHRKRVTGKNKEHIFKAVPIQPIEQLIQSRTDQGTNWVDATRELMELYRNNQDIDSAVVGGASLDTEINQLADSDFINAGVIGYPIDEESKNHFYSKLATIPPDAQQQVIHNYILIATSPPDPDTRLTPLALANLSMIQAEKKYNLSKTGSKSQGLVHQKK